jgi:hypothetical protein
MWEQQIANYMPYYLVFHVGGNDVDVVGCSDELIDTTVIRLVNFLNTMKIRYGDSFCYSFTDYATHGHSACAL